MTDGRDAFEIEVIDWLDERGRTTAAEVRELADRIGAFPDRRRREPSWLAAAAAVVVAVGLGALVLGRSPAGGAAGPTPPDPAAYAGDPRLAACFGATTQSALDTFEMRHASDYRRHLPAMGLSPELDVDAPAFVVVFRDPPLVGELGAPAGSGATATALGTAAPGRHDVCVLVGSDPAAAERNLYSDVDTSGLIAVLPDETAAASPADTMSADPMDASSPAPSTSALSTQPSRGPSAPPTTPPRPAWVADVATKLECDGGGGTRSSSPVDTSFAASSDVELANAIAAIQFYDYPFPIEDYAPAIEEPGAVLYAYTVDGRVKAAIAVVRLSEGDGALWTIGSRAACPVDEFDPRTPVGSHGIGAWTDAAGQSVPRSVLSAAADCYGGTQVRFGGRLYVRIPGGGVDPGQLEATWSEHATLPTSARRTQYHSGDVRLFVAADRSAIFFVRSDRVERLPHVIGDEVVRTDCN